MADGTLAQPTIAPIPRYDTLEANVRRHWKPLLGVLVLSVIGINVLAPDWNALQGARDAARFVALVDHPSRVLGAAACDVVFAACYGALGCAGLRRWGGTAGLPHIAAIVLLVGAISDEIENAIVALNVVRRTHLSDAWVDAMHVPGTFKWLAAPPVLLLYGYLIRAAIRRRSGRAS